MTVQIDIIDYLSEQEKSRLKELEAIVTKGKKVFIIVGDALIEIMRDKLYRETHATFELYCDEVHDISRRRAYQIAEGARNVQNVTHAGLIPPTSESAARALSPLEPSMQSVAWEWAQVIAQREQPPASLVKVIVADIKTDNPAVFKLEVLKREYRGVAWDVMMQFVDAPEAQTMAVVVDVFARSIAPDDVDLVEYYTAKVNEVLDTEGEPSFKDQVILMAQIVSGSDKPPAKTIDKVTQLMASTPTLGEAMAGIPKGLMPLVWALSNRLTNAQPTTNDVQWVAGHVRADEVATGSPVERTMSEWLAHLKSLMADEKPVKPKPKGSAIESGLDDEPLRPASSKPKDLEDVPEENGGELDRDEWCITETFLDEVVRPWLGTIELDPCSSPWAQEVIRAITPLYKEHDGLGRDWNGKVYMHPPRSQPLVTQFCEKLAMHHTKGDVPIALAIINNTTDTNAYHALAKTARFEAHPPRQIKLWHRDAKCEDYDRNKQMVFFFGDGNTCVIQDLLNEGWSIKQRIDYNQDGDSAWAIQELSMAAEALGVEPGAGISLWRVIKCLMVHLDQHGITFDPNGFKEQEERPVPPKFEDDLDAYGKEVLMALDGLTEEERDEAWYRACDETGKAQPDVDLFDVIKKELLAERPEKHASKRKARQLKARLARCFYVARGFNEEDTNKIFEKARSIAKRQGREEPEARDMQVAIRFLFGASEGE